MGSGPEWRKPGLTPSTIEAPGPEWRKPGLTPLDVREAGGVLRAGGKEKGRLGWFPAGPASPLRENYMPFL
jgi:hypothetical protein